MDTQAFVAASDLNVIIAFCGSESLPDWLTNFDCVNDLGPFPESSVHEGFQDSLFPVLLQIASCLRISNLQGTKKLWLTGHSLGGALAVLLAAMFAVEKIPICGVYTYGAPRLGNLSFAKSYDECLGDITYRLVNEGDLVPHLPPEFLGFLHCGKAILFRSDGPRMDNDNTTWTRFRESIGAWMSHIGKKDLAIRDYHLLPSPNGYLQKLEQDLDGKIVANTFEMTI
ncbi:lipase family protein [bacterium]|nr:lipase family protein [bacterium]